MKGRPRYGVAKKEGCTVINWRLEEQHTSIRADTSGSQSRATMQRAMIRIQLKPTTRAKFGARFVLDGRPDEEYRVVELMPRYDAVGRLHHYQCDLEKL